VKSKHRLSIRAPLVGWGIVAFYLFTFTSGGCIRPFVNLYLAEIGMDGTQIGLLQGWTALATVLFTPLFGFLADRSQRHRLYLVLMIFLKSLFAPLTLLSNAFPWLTITFSVRNISASVADALLNSLSLTRLRQFGRADLGSVRLWGSIGYAAMSMLAGWLAGGRSISVLFPLAGVLGMLALPFGRSFPPRIKVTQAVSTQPAGRQKISLPLLWLFATIFLFSFSYNGLETFGFVYLSLSLGASNQLIGVLGAVRGLAPILGLFLADVCVRRWGAPNTLMISFGVYLLALCGYALIPSAVMALPVFWWRRSEYRSCWSVWWSR
jgi:PPP family 3-phenylpropionic acid transporter